MTPDSQNFSVAVSYVAGADLSESYRVAVLDLVQSVVNRLTASGVTAVPVNAADPAIDAQTLLASVDGVVVMGGIDMDPAVYGEKITADNLHYLNQAADEYEVSLVQGAAKTDTPVFGVCRGSQVINVAFGGSLIQDLGQGIHVASVPGGDTPVDDAWTNHDVFITPDTKLAALLGAEPLDARVGHHQAVDRVGDGLVVAASAEDGIVEAVEAIDGWILGVQWHPEEAKANPQMLGLLIDGFVEAMAARQPQQA